MPMSIAILADVICGALVGGLVGVWGFPHSSNHQYNLDECGAS